MGNSELEPVKAPYNSSKMYKTKLIGVSESSLNKHELSQLHQFLNEKEVLELLNNLGEKAQLLKEELEKQLLVTDSPSLTTLMNNLLTLCSYSGHLAPLTRAILFLIQLNIEDQKTKMEKFIKKEIAQKIIESYDFLIEAKFKTAIWTNCSQQSEIDPTKKIIKVEISLSMLLECMIMIESLFEGKKYKQLISQLNPKEKIFTFSSFHKLYHRIASLRNNILTSQTERKNHQTRFKAFSHKLKTSIIEERLQCIKHSSINPEIIDEYDCIKFKKYQNNDFVDQKGIYIFNACIQSDVKKKIINDFIEKHLQNFNDNQIVEIRQSLKLNLGWKTSAREVIEILNIRLYKSIITKQWNKYFDQIEKKQQKSAKDVKGQRALIFKKK